MPSAYPLDHLVLPVADLGVAQARLESLGFTVAPRGVHPFGTENCCVYFADDTFMEHLARADDALIARAEADRNAFVRLDRLYRQAAGSEGFSALVLGTGDAAADDRRFRAAGLSAGPILDFSRHAATPSGEGGMASFRLAFAAPRADAAGFAFTCQRINVPAIDRTALQTHANGVKGISSVVAVSDDPAACAAFLADIAQTSADHGTVRLRNATVEVVTAAAFRSRFGLPPAAGTRFAATGFAVDDLDALRTLLGDAEVQTIEADSRLIVPPAPGQGALFIFEETT